MLWRQHKIPRRTISSSSTIEFSLQQYTSIIRSAKLSKLSCSHVVINIVSTVQCIEIDFQFSIRKQMFCSLKIIISPCRSYVRFEKDRLLNLSKREGISDFRQYHTSVPIDDKMPRINQKTWIRYYEPMKNVPLPSSEHIQQLCFQMIKEK